MAPQDPLDNAEREMEAHKRVLAVRWFSKLGTLAFGGRPFTQSMLSALSDEQINELAAQLREQDPEAAELNRALDALVLFREPEDHGPHPERPS